MNKIESISSPAAEGHHAAWWRSLKEDVPIKLHALTMLAVLATGGASAQQSNNQYYNEQQNIQRQNHAAEQNRIGYYQQMQQQQQQAQQPLQPTGYWEKTWGRLRHLVSTPCWG